jgi:hypothetical protein
VNPRRDAARPHDAPSQHLRAHRLHVLPHDIHRGLEVHRRTELHDLGSRIDLGRVARTHISEAIDRISENVSRVRDELSRMNREPDEQSLLTSMSRLRQAGPELSAALLSGPEQLRRRILSRLVKEVTYLKEDRNIEVTLILPHPDVPLRVAAPDDLSAPGGPRSASQKDSARGGIRTPTGQTMAHVGS